ncbi:MAG TPA: hypothetical protein VFN03_04180 [Trueperaceae bacterium]|nr:hypothetical protein [Trueperaceae bacterium]
MTVDLVQDVRRLAVEHGRITETDGALLAESFQTRLTAGRGARRAESSRRTCSARWR